MKKLLTAVVLTASFGAIKVNAQSLEIIPKAGISVSSQMIKDVNGEKFKVGFQGGVGFNISTGKGGFSVQPELNFLSKGMAIKGTGAKKEKFNLNYLEIPVLAKYSFGPVYVNAGPAIGLKLGESKAIKKEYGAIKKIDFGVQLGAGVALPAGPGKVIVDARYALGLSNISDVKGTEIKNRGFIASIGYAIPLGK
ncbi:porin family protein [Sphingobacterium sp. BS-2]|uniref:porin family protein n=1 Tax=Sphingobacterium sp. BS-2 TaxID=3377129 RepID=UPI0038FBE4AD